MKNAQSNNLSLKDMIVTLNNSAMLQKLNTFLLNITNFLNQMCQ